MEGFKFDGFVLWCLILFIAAIIFVVNQIRRIKSGNWIKPIPGQWDGTSTQIKYDQIYQVNEVKGKQLTIVGLSGSYPIEFFKKAKPPE